MTEAERWQQAKALFFEALDLAPSEREAFLDAACGDEGLRHQVRALLDSDAREYGGVLDEPVLGGPAGDTQEQDPDLDSRVGAYRLVHRLGRGGMGDVYLAERTDGAFHQKVALKLIRRGLDTDDVLARFHYERQILAWLDHPHIATLHDGGVTEDGRPYFVMEYVDGDPITDYCDHHRLPTRQRLALFRTVCRAVQYAHRNLVVHRDLKPSNILVTRDGAVKLLDFGIAKLLQDEGIARTALTQTGQHVMTPEYASPEQVRGEAITTATDVYQLGVLLYELLTGRRPYQIEKHVRWAIERAILEEEPPRPSTAVRETTTTRRADAESVSTARATHPAELARALSGDLDTICLTALQKDAERRYASVEQFAEDVRRHLAGLPITARADSAFYRLGKFIRRHRVAVAAHRLNGDGPVRIGIATAVLAGLYGNAGQPDSAVANHTRAVELLREALGADHLETIIARISLALQLYRNGTLEASLQAAQPALDDARTQRARARLHRFYLETGRTEEASQLGGNG